MLLARRALLIFQVLPPPPVLLLREEVVLNADFQVEVFEVLEGVLAAVGGEGLVFLIYRFEFILFRCATALLLRARAQV